MENFIFWVVSSQKWIKINFWRYAEKRLKNKESAMKMVALMLQLFQ